MNRLWCRMRVSCGMFDMIISEKTDNVKMRPDHYSDVMMGVMTSQITSLSIVYSTVYSGADQRKHQSSLSLQDIPYKMLIILFGVISSLVATGFIWVIFPCTSVILHYHWDKYNGLPSASKLTLQNMIKMTNTKPQLNHNKSCAWCLGCTAHLLHDDMTWIHGNAFCVTGPLCGETMGHQWIPLTMGQ